MGFRRRSTGETVVAKTETSSKVDTKKPSKGGSSKFNKMGAILEKKDGGVWLKIGDDFDISGLSYNGKPVKSLQVEDPTSKYDRMVESGKLTEKEADEKASKVPSYVLFEVTLVTE